MSATPSTRRRSGRGSAPLVVLFLVRLPRRLLLHDVRAVSVVRRADLAADEGTAQAKRTVALLADVERARGRVGLVVERVVALVARAAAQALLVAFICIRLVEQRLRGDLLVLGPRRLVAAVVRAGSYIQHVQWCSAGGVRAPQSIINLLVVERRPQSAGDALAAERVAAVPQLQPLRPLDVVHADDAREGAAGR